MTTINNRAATPLPEIALRLLGSVLALDGFAAQKILPAYPVNVPQGLIPVDVMDRRIYSASRDPLGGFLRIATEIDNKNFHTAEAGLEALLFDGELPLYGDLATGQMKKARQVVLSLLLAREVSAANILFSTTTFDAAHRVDVANADRFDAAAGANPINTLSAALTQVENRIGVRPNKLAIPSAAYNALTRHPAFLAEVKALPAYSGLGSGVVPSIVPAATLAALLELEEVIVLRHQKDTANRAKASALAPLWDKTKALAFYSKPIENEDMSLGHTFIYDEGLVRSAQTVSADLETNAALAFKVDTYREEAKTADVVRVRENLVQMVTNEDAGCLLTNILPA
jgi:hypothetical protein